MNRQKIFLSFLFSFLFALTSMAKIPTGYYYFAKGKNKAELKTTLKEISSPLYLLHYGSGEGATWEGFYKTDRNPVDNSVVDMYSPVKRYFNEYNSVSGIDIEHSFPKSWWGGHPNYAYRDLHHLYPSDSRTNSTKNNFPLGEIGNQVVFYNEVSTIGENIFGKEYSGRAFEPSDEFKGDFARAYFYISTIYEDLYPLWNSAMLNNELYPMWKPWAIDLLLKWHRQDPVSDKERIRNEKVFEIQNNRNPFIDYPELVEHIWGNQKDIAFDFDIGDEAFLISPTRNFHMDMGAVMQNTEQSTSFLLQGINIKSDVHFSINTQKSHFSLSKTSATAHELTNGIDIEISVLTTELGVISDTLLINGGGLQTTVEIPIKVVISSEFLALGPTEITPVGALLHWFDDNQADSYRLTLYEGAEEAGDLIISTYYEGLSNDKAIELFNGTGSTIDLSKYQLKKQSNGIGAYTTNLNLSGTLAHGKTYLIVYSRSTNEELQAKADLFNDSILAFNGNDAIALFRNEMQIDIVGTLDGGADYYWGQDKVLKRKSSITHPKSTFNIDEWEELPYSDLAVLGTHTMSFANNINYIFKNEDIGSKNHYEISSLRPDTRYTYFINSVINQANAKKTANTVQFRTNKLDAPIALEASDISTNSFTANWEDHPYTQNFIIDLFTLSGSVISELESFDNVNSSGGNLPAGWSGTASGNYTSAVSSGENPPSVGLKRDKEWLQTKTYEQAVTQLQFMYRFPSNASGSYFTIEAFNKSGASYLVDKINYQNSSKHSPIYHFDSDHEYNQFRFTYYKSQGNLAIDDVYVKHGGVDTLFVHHNLPTTQVSHEFTDLTPNKEYYYRLFAQLDNSFSNSSNIIKTELLLTGILEIEQERERTNNVLIKDDLLIISHLQKGENISLYTANGNLIYKTISNGNTHIIKTKERGLLILLVGNSKAVKLVKHK